MPSIDSNISLVPLPPTSSGLRANASPGVSNLQVSPSPYSEFSSLLPPGTTDPSTLVPSIFSTSFDDADLIKDDSEISTGGFQVEAPAVNLDDIDTLNEIPGLTHILSSRGIILFMSPIFTREVLEYEPSELVGRNLSEFCHTGDNTSLMRELQGSEIGKKVSAMYRFRRKHSGFVWIEVLGHKYGIDNRKKTKCFVLSGRVRQTGVLPHGALSNTEQAQGSLTNEQVQSMDFWAKLSTYGLFLYIVPSSAFLFESAHEVLYTQSLLDYVTDGTRDAVQRGLEALAQRRTTTGSVDPITVRAMLHTRHLPVWIQLFPGASGSSSTNDQQQDYVDQSPCSFVFMKMSTLEPESGVSSRSAVYPLSALSLDIFSPLRMSQSAGLQFELNQLKEGNRQLSGAIENLRQGGSAH